jgi:hypothetical protein
LISLVSIDEKRVNGDIDQSIALESKMKVVCQKSLASEISVEKSSKKFKPNDFDIQSAKELNKTVVVETKNV